MTSSLQAVSSPEQFQESLSADLERISVLYFYADWAEPCAAMTQAVAALAEAKPEVLFLSIEAEALVEVSESFEVRDGARWSVATSCEELQRCRCVIAAFEDELLICFSITVNDPPGLAAMSTLLSGRSSALHYHSTGE